MKKRKLKAKLAKIEKTLDETASKLGRIKSKVENKTDTLNAVSQPKPEPKPKGPARAKAA